MLGVVEVFTIYFTITAQVVVITDAVVKLKYSRHYFRNGVTRESDFLV